MELSENINHLVYTVDSDLISISALNTDDREATESMQFPPWCLEVKSSTAGVRWTNFPSILSMMLWEWRPKRMPPSITLVRVPRGGGGGVPGALKISAVEPGARSFYWLEPWYFFGCGARSPKKFCAEPGAQHFQVWSFEFPDCIDSWLLPFCVCLCVWTGVTKQNLKRAQYITQVYTAIQFIMICNNLFRVKTLSVIKTTL